MPNYIDYHHLGLNPEVFKSDTELTARARSGITEALTRFTYKRAFLVGDMTGHYYTENSSVDVLLQIEKPYQAEAMQEAILLSDRYVAGTSHRLSVVVVSTEVSPEVLRSKFGPLLDLLSGIWIGTRASTRAELASKAAFLQRVNWKVFKSRKSFEDVAKDFWELELAVFADIPYPEQIEILEELGYRINRLDSYITKTLVHLPRETWKQLNQFEQQLEPLTSGGDSAVELLRSTTNLPELQRELMLQRLRYVDLRDRLQEVAATLKERGDLEISMKSLPINATVTTVTYYPVVVVRGGAEKLDALQAKLAAKHPKKLSRTSRNALALTDISKATLTQLMKLSPRIGVTVEAQPAVDVAVPVATSAPVLKKADPALDAGKWYFAEAKEDVYPFLYPRQLTPKGWEVDLLTASNAVPTRKVLSADAIAAFGLRPATEDDFAALDLPVPSSQQLVQASRHSRMANISEKTMAVLNGGVRKWNEWIAAQREEKKDFSADLIKLQAKGAKLAGADFANCNLSQAVLTEAKVQQTIFDKCNLTDASFDGADLRGASFDDADMRSTSFATADLRGAVLFGYISKDTDLKGARYDATTKFPPDFDPEKAGMKLEGKEKSGRAAADGSPQLDEDHLLARRDELEQIVFGSRDSRERSKARAELKKINEALHQLVLQEKPSRPASTTTKPKKAVVKVNTAALANFDLRGKTRTGAVSSTAAVWEYWQRRAESDLRLGELKIKQTHFKSYSPKQVAEAFKAGKQVWLFDCSDQCDKGHIVKQILIGTKEEVQKYILSTVGATLVFKGQWQKGWTLTALEEKDLAAFLPGTEKKADYEFLDEPPHSPVPSALNEVVFEITQAMHDYMSQSPPSDLYDSSSELARLEQDLALEMTTGYISGMPLHDQTMLAIKLRTLGGGVDALVEMIAPIVLDQYRHEVARASEVDGSSGPRRPVPAKPKSYTLTIELANEEDVDEYGRREVPRYVDMIYNRLEEIYEERFGTSPWSTSYGGLEITVTNASDAISAEMLFKRAYKETVYGGHEGDEGVDYVFHWDPYKPIPQHLQAKGPHARRYGAPDAKSDTGRDVVLNDLKSLAESIKNSVDGVAGVDSWAEDYKMPIRDLLKAVKSKLTESYNGLAKVFKKLGQEPTTAATRTAYRRYAVYR